MPEDTLTAIRKPIWTNIIFFALTTLLGVIAAPLYIVHHGFSLSEFLLFAFYMIATPLSITMGYHRLFAHKSYKAHPLVRFLLLFFGAAAFEQSAYRWASQHRVHHRYVDTDRDPYSIKKGFFYAHIGWLIFWKQPDDYSNVQDLEQDRIVFHQHRYFKYWAIGSGILLPLLIGAMTGHLLGALLIAVCARITFVYHATFCINSVCHMFGKNTYDIYSSAKDNWFSAILTYGEGYHNYHHHFPVDYRNGVRWFHWDPTKWMIRLLSFLGLAYELKRISHYKIIAARIRAQHQEAIDALMRYEGDSKLDHLKQNLIARYQQLRVRLAEWEKNHEFKPRFQEKLREWEMLYASALIIVAALPKKL
jgi:stearoyl-CoA desaturase (Delta-9 desaturase)